MHTSTPRLISQICSCPRLSPLAKKAPPESTCKHHIMGAKWDIESTATADFPFRRGVTISPVIRKITRPVLCHVFVCIRVAKLHPNLNRCKLPTHCTQRIAPSLPPMNSLFNSEFGWNATDKAATFWLVILPEILIDFKYVSFSPESSPYLRRELGLVY